MPAKINTILHENGNFFVVKENKGYSVYENTNHTHARKWDIIGSDGAHWLSIAIGKCNVRAAAKAVALTAAALQKTTPININ